MNILVTDGENRSALAVTRSLGKRRCRVVVAGHEEYNLASSSKFCHRSFKVSDPLQNGDDYIKAISNIAVAENIDFIFPMTEQSIYLLNPVRDRLPGKAVLACPPVAQFQAVGDKSELFRLAGKLNVPVPRTLYLEDTGDLSSVIRKIDRYPVVVKPALSRIPTERGFITAGVRYATSQSELEHLYETSMALRFPSMIQELIVGPGTGLFTLYDGDRHLALFSHRRLREKPPSGGVSVVSESFPLDAEMVDAADRILSSVGWTGVAMVEFKRDVRDGRAKLMEINGRFWGSLQLAIASGVNFPALLLDYLTGKRPSAPVQDYQVGHKLKWFFGTLDHLLIRLKHRREELNLPLDSPSRAQAVFDFLKFFERDTSFDVFDKNDPGPFWHEARAYFKDVIRVRG